MLIDAIILTFPEETWANIDLPQTEHQWQTKVTIPAQVLLDELMNFLLGAWVTPEQSFPCVMTSTSMALSFSQTSTLAPLSPHTIGAELHAAGKWRPYSCPDWDSRGCYTQRAAFHNNNSHKEKMLWVWVGSAGGHLPPWLITWVQFLKPIWWEENTNSHWLSCDFYTHTHTN